ncbi:PIN domain-containing protein [Candidatus Woesearchaeota archaeon]|nr:PIN domain-containing protein [Candidatus Woesearchaeota archaeon]
MAEKYYLDTCIWRDHYENREGPGGRPLGSYATKLFTQIMKKRDIIVFSSHIIYEMKKAFAPEEVEDMFKILDLMKILQRVEVSKSDWEEARKLATERDVSRSDALHAVLARNNNAILITQNMKDFEKFNDFITIKRPEDII